MEEFDSELIRVWFPDVQWRRQRCFLAGATVGLNDPVMVLRDERLFAVLRPRFRLSGGGGVIQDYTEKADNLYVRFQLIYWWCYGKVTIFLRQNPQHFGSFSHSETGDISGDSGSRGQDTENGDCPRSPYAMVVLL